jgi:hypothetical protein
MRTHKRTRIIVGSLGVAVLGAGVAVIPALTTAAWSDGAYLNTQEVGGKNNFDIGLVEGGALDASGLLQGGTVRQASGTGVAWEIPGADRLVPGQTISANIGVFNNSPGLDADVIMRIEPTQASSLDIADYLVFSVTDVATGTKIVDSLYINDFNKVGAEFMLASRGADSELGDGDPFAASDGASARLFRVDITYSESTADGRQETESLNGGKAYLRAAFDAASK